MKSNKKFFGAITKVVLLSLALAMSFQFNILPVRAASLTVMSDTMTRLAVSTRADHVILFTLAAGTDFDVTGFEDQINVLFDPVDSAFTVGAGWLDADFTIKNATTNHAWNPYNTQVGAAAVPDCTGAGSDDVAVAVDTADDVFRFRACAGTGFVATGLGHNIEIVIKGASGTGTLTNPIAGGSRTIFIGHTDDGTPDKNEGSIAVGIIDGDQVNIHASVDPTLTFDIDISLTDSETGEPYDLDLGTISPGAVKTSNNTTVKSIWIDLETNATSGATITVLGAYGGLQSTATAHTIGGADTTLVAGTEGTGVCLSYVSMLTGVAPYQSGNCGGTKHTVGKVNTTATNILTTGGAPADNGRAEIMVKAAVSNLTPAASDYADTFTFIATATF